MRTLYAPEALNEMVSRIEKLTPATAGQWGKMNVSQMMEHCSRALDLAAGKEKPPRMLLGYLLGSFMKSTYYNDKPWDKNTPTAKSFVVVDTPEFEKTKQRLLAVLNEFSKGGPEKCTTHPSPFFGHLTPEQHGMGQYKHLNHHLQQFGV